MCGHVFGDHEEFGDEDTDSTTVNHAQIKWP